MKRIQIKSKSEIVEEQIIEHFRGAKNNKLPSEEDLCKMTGVSRTTVRAALTRLEKKGIINKKDRVGSFFLNSVLDTRDRVEDYINFIKMIEDAGYAPSLTMTFQGELDQDKVPAEKLSMKPNEPLLYFIWEYRADEQIAFIVHYYVPKSLFHELPPDRTYQGEEVHTSVFGKYGDMEYSHYIATLSIKNHPETNIAFGLEPDASLIGFDEYLYNYQDQAFAYSSNYVNPKMFSYNLINIWD